MTYDDDERVPDLRSVLEDFLTVLLRPAVVRVNRAALWWGRLRRFEVDWSGFAVTAGGFFDLFGMPIPGDCWYDGERDLERAVEGLGWQEQAYSYGSPRWEPWRRWWRPWTITDVLPKLTAQRGGIRYVPPPLFEDLR